MIAASKFAGIWAATITPVTVALAPDAPRALPYYRELLERGCNGLNILGTTGEAMSLSADQRSAYMTALIEGGLPGERVMFGTGAAALMDAVALTRTAKELGVAAALVMPPFFYRDVADDGIVRWFDTLLSRTEAPPIVLYNFPRMSGITFSVDLVERLMHEFPKAIVGMKDSSNDAELQRAMLARHPDFVVLPGSEETLGDALAYGASGCISGSVCLWPELANDVFRTRDVERARELAEQRRTIPPTALIPAVRARIAAARNDAAWLRTMPPL